jgi:diguanylate cyclase (GGDEF)-like protein
MRRPFHLGLLGKFALASAVPLLAMGLVLGKYLANRVHDRTLAQAKTSAELIARVGFQPQIKAQYLQDGKLPDSVRTALDKTLQSKQLEDGLTRIKIWNKNGEVIYSDKRDQIGNKYQLFQNMNLALQGQTVASVTRLQNSEARDGRTVGRVLEVYVPLRVSEGAAPLGAVNFFLPYEPIAREISHETRTLYLFLLAGIGLVWLILFRIVAGASRRLRMQAEELEQHADEKEYQALHDPLTELPNRALFSERIQYALYDAEDDGREVAVLLMDLDRFKEINDTLGHHCGDLLLQELGSRLKTALRESDTVARLGGDEFGILLPSIPDRRVINEIVERIRTAVEEPFNLQGLPLAIETSIGVSIYPDHADDVDTLMQRADVAMYQAKSKNSLFEVYDEQQDEYDPRRLTLVGELRRALDEEELVVFYQPKAVLGNGDVDGVEALVRWQHPERGLLPPDEFIPLAEHTGLIGPLTMYVLDRAMAQCREWRDSGMNINVAVNMAMRNLLDLAFPDRVAEVLDKWRLAPTSLELEITENTIMGDPFRSMQVLRRLNEMGVKLSIDDFGTGYSSLAYLKRLPVDAVKIDKSFVLGMSADDNDGAIVRSTIDLARNLGLRVVAEGVETSEIWTELRALGCDFAQGYLLSRPLPAAELTAWLGQRKEFIELVARQDGRVTELNSRRPAAVPAEAEVEAPPLAEALLEQ